MATKIRPIVFKINEPERFVMNASNATYTLSGNTIYISWQGPNYPDAYNGNGQQYILVNNNVDTVAFSQLMYATVNDGGGPSVINQGDMQVLGTSTGVLSSHSIPPASGYGKFLTLGVNADYYTLEQIQDYMTKVSITIFID